MKVPGYSNYMVSTEGKVKSFDPRWKSPRIMKPGKQKTGYRHVTLSNDGKATTFLLHRLVIKAFIGDSDLPVNHKDGNKENNQIDNLEYVTHSQNMQHAIATGLHKPNTDEIALKKRKPVQMIDIESGETIFIFNSAHEAARETGWNRGNISKACRENGKTCGYRWSFL